MPTPPRLLRWRNSTSMPMPMITPPATAAYQASICAMLRKCACTSTSSDSISTAVNVLSVKPQPILRSASQ
ncbi:hypothetical protein D3C72_2461790 [compost metagenome]